MIVDDSVVVRGLISRWIGLAPGFRVVSAAANGRAALAELDAAAPDIVLLDLDMPEIGGLEALPEILARRPSTSVIVVSTLTKRNAEVSLHCLALGAVDYLPKPGSQRELATCTEFRRDLLARVEAISTRHRGAPASATGGAPASSAPPSPPAQPDIIRLPAHRRGCVLIGASTGGPRALLELLRPLARTLERVPILVVQHMPAIFTAVFAEQIQREAGLSCGEARDGERVGPGRVYLAPGGRHMGLELMSGETMIRLDDGPPIHHCRPSVDVLFRDAARAYGAAAAGIVLTGMGTDGTDGARALVDVGATIIAQDEATSVVWGMPGSVARAGLARAVLPIGEIAPAIEAAFGGRR